MTNGIDVSHHQKVIEWPKVKADFAIMKVTQGTSFVDPMFQSNKDGARAAGILCGYYHFAGNYKPETGQSIPSDPIVEANHFLSKVGDIREGEIVVLDWEVDHVNPGEWCHAFMRQVEGALGFKPFFYSYESRIKRFDFSKIAKAGYPLWIAKYGDNDQIAEPNEKPNTDDWAFYIIWQFSSTGKKAGISTRVDLNESDLDIAAIKRYGKPGELPVPTPGNEPVIVRPGTVISNLQSNKEWGSIKIGNSPVTVASDGCLITVVSDITYWAGKYYTPGQLAKLLQFTKEGKLFWESLSRAGLKFVFRYWNFNKETQLSVEKALAHPTLCVGLEVTLRSGTKHWVWGLSTKFPKYKMGDPLYGDFSNTLTRYGARITGAAVIDTK